jgi:hypothetical protein
MFTKETSLLKIEEIEDVLNECFSYLLKKNKKYISKRGFKKVLKRHFKELFLTVFNFNT